MQSASRPIPSPCGFQWLCFQPSGLGPCHFQDILFSFPGDGEPVLGSGQRWGAWRGQPATPWSGMRRQLVQCPGLSTRPRSSRFSGGDLCSVVKEHDFNHPLVPPLLGHGILTPRWPFLSVTCPTLVCSCARPTHICVQAHTHTHSYFSGSLLLWLFSQTLHKNQAAHNNNHGSLCLSRFWVEPRTHASQLTGGSSSCLHTQVEILKVPQKPGSDSQDQIIFQRRSKGRSVGGLMYLFIVKHSQNIFSMSGSGIGGAYESG